MGNMMKRKSTIFFGIITLLAFILLAPNTSIVKKAYANDESTIAGIRVGSLKEDEIRTTLSDAIATWTQNPPTIQGGGSTLTIDPASLNFDIEATLSIYYSLTDKPWYAFWKSIDPVHIPLEVTGTENVKEAIANASVWNVEETFALALQQITNLKSDPIEATVVDTSILETERLTFIIQDIPKTAKAVYDLAVQLDGTVIGAGESFSFLTATDSIANNSNAEGLNFVASMLYRNALYTNTRITERYAQHEIPNYLEPGLEALVDPIAMKDLSFTNNSTVPYKLKMSVQGQKLKAEVYSSANPNSVAVRVTQSGEVNPRTIVRYSDDLSMGSQRLLQEGEKGARVAIFRTIDGFEEQMARDYYPPTNRIVVKSSRVPQTSTTVNTGGTSTNTQTNVPEDTLDLDNDGLPDINQGAGPEPQVDQDGNVILAPGQTTNKSGDVISTGGGTP